MNTKMKTNRTVFISRNLRPKSLNMRVADMTKRIPVIIGKTVGSFFITNLLTNIKYQGYNIKESFYQVKSGNIEKATPVNRRKS